MKATPEDHPDLESLTKAYSKLNHLVSVVNENSREANNLKRLKEISGALGDQSEVSSPLPPSTPPPHSLLHFSTNHYITINDHNGRN